MKNVYFVIITIILLTVIVWIDNTIEEKKNKREYNLYKILWIILYAIGGFCLSRIWYACYIGSYVNETLRLMLSTVIGYFLYLVIILIVSSIYKLRKIGIYF